VHFIGIGGAGMSAIAAILVDQGAAVSGSDLKGSRNTQRLEEAGAEICIGHRPENVEGASLVVYSSAIRDSNREMVRARELGLEVIPRAVMLSRLMAEREGLAVAGTHGKTTTTSMLAKIFSDAGLDPTFIVGGELNDIGGNARTGRGRHLIAEADESDGSFLYLEPSGVIITNIE
jgi:UDP-N-acetylmuramate--alanine ligase